MVNSRMIPNILGEFFSAALFKKVDCKNISGGKKDGAGEGPLVMDEGGMGQTRGQNK